MKNSTLAPLFIFATLQFQKGALKNSYCMPRLFSTEESVARKSLKLDFSLSLSIFLLF